MSGTKRLLSAALAGAALSGALSTGAEAAPALRAQVTQKGDFVLLGNTLGQDCSTAATFAGNPVVGTVGPCAAPFGNLGPDVFWESDFPAAGMATASTAITGANARSTAVLNVPPGALVTGAYLYWGSRPSGLVADTAVVLDRPGLGAFTANVTSLATMTANGAMAPTLAYQSVADVTAIVKQNGAGAYRVSGVDSHDLSLLDAPNQTVGWWMVVFYNDNTAPLRQVTLFDGLDFVNSMNGTVNTPLSGFLVPAAGYTAHLGVIAYGGDASATGDQLLWNGTPLFDALNPVSNFFNGTRSNLGVAVSNVGDLPQLTGTAGSMSEMDLDIVDITANVTPGQTSATIGTKSTGDTYFLGGFITSISTFAPDFTGSVKTVADITSGSLASVHAGDILQYTITLTNIGNDTSTNTVLNDPLPAGVTYVPGSLAITAGAGAGAKTDASADDQGEYLSGMNLVTFRVGTGANGTMGGTLLVGASSTVTFQVQINAGATGTISNQGTITAAGLLGAPATSFLTNGNGPPPTSSTVITISGCPIAACACLADSDCGGPTSGTVCDNGSGGTFTCIPGCRGAGGNGCMTGLACTSTTSAIGSCVTCTTDSQCGNATSGLVCNGATHACQPGCRGMNGNGCPVIDVCTSSTSVIGACVQCLVDSTCGGPMSGLVCNAATNTCQPGCRGMNGNGCPTGESCTSMTSLIGACVNCLVDADCGGLTSGIVCNAGSHTCQPGCRGMMLGNGCPTGDVCTSPNATIGACVQCTTDADCGGPMSGTVCNGATQTCQPGCRGMNGNGCAAGQACTSLDSTIGNCVQCTTDADCGGVMSGIVCDAATSQCKPGCRGMNGNGCPAGDTCTSLDSTIGTCVQCAKDADCGGPTSGTVCDAATSQCKPGCRGSGGNGCPTGDTCTSTDGTIGTCVQCTKDADCGSTTSGQVCDATGTCAPGCRGTGGNGCPSMETCTSTDNTIGTCVQCATDADCGGPMSGTVCDAATSQCKPGCRGMNGNGCPTGMNCTSPDTTIGMCVQCTADAQCGDSTSGTVCDAATGTCGPGCRGMGGNGCPTGDVCTSQDTTVGSCVQCTKDADCGGPVSGIICDVMTNKCGPGCRGMNGNGCPSGQQCSSTDATAGMCGAATGTGGSSSSSSGTGGAVDGITASGNGLICAAQPGSGDDDAGAWILGGLAGLVLASRRRRRR
jgi:uncharacterized repeat protein (TIGR01451 family)/MYXO-CTERM domain-containing protein